MIGLLENIIFTIIRFFNSLIIKSKNKILFISRPDFSDNAYYMYKYMQEQNMSREMNWIIYDENIYDILIKKGYKNVYLLKSISGIWIYLRSKFIITSSSSLWQIKSPFQKQYDLWHGIPLKNVLCMGEKNIKPKRQAGNINKRFATSSLSKALLAASFDFNAMKIEVSGQPRTDVLFEKNNFLQKLIDKDISDFRRIVIYMPTYRHGFRDKSEGKSFDKENIFRFDKYNHKKFLDFLRTNKILFLLKLHPYEEKLYKSMELGNNIKWITNELLVENDIGIYDILPETDILITDYSSIFFDYLLLDKKIIFTPVDLDYYKNNRGFELEPYEFWTPGIKVFDQQSLMNEFLKNDDVNERRNRKIVKDIMFYHQDGKNAKRVMNIIEGDL